LSFNWQVGVWDVRTGRLRWRFDVPHGLFIDNACFAFRADGRQLTFAAGKAARCWDLETGRETGTWDFPYEGLQDALAFPTPDALLSFRFETRQGVPPFSDYSPEQYPRVCRIRNLHGPDPSAPIAEITQFKRGVSQALASPDGSCFVVFGPQVEAGESRPVVRAYNAQTGSERFALLSEPGRILNSLIGFDPTGRVLVIDTRESLALQVDSTTGYVEDSLQSNLRSIGPGANYVKSIGPGTRYLVYIRDDSQFPPKELALVRRRAGTVLVMFVADSSPSGMVTFNPAGDLLAWGTTEGVVFVADLERVRQRLAEVGLGW
jgi:WD40 repeat protein